MSLPIIETIPLLKLASGDNFCLQIYKFVGSQSEKKAYIQANLHGGEIVGNAVIYELIEFLSNLNPEQIVGEIWLVPLCNPLGTNQRDHFFATGRYNHYDGRDWNRIFWDYEKVCEDLQSFAQSQLNNPIEEIRENFLKKQLAAWQKELEKQHESDCLPYYKLYRYQLQSLCLDANYVIDIHSSSNYAIDYTYCFQSRETSAKYFGLNYGILMTKYDGDAFDEAFMKPWLALEKKLAKLGRNLKFAQESWTLELGSGMQMNPESVVKGITGIKSYLTYQRMLKLDPDAIISTEIQFFTREQIQNYYAPTGGMIENRLPLETQVKTGDRLYQILTFNKQGKLPTKLDIYAQKDGIIFDVSINHSVNQGEYVLAIMCY